MFKNYTIKNPTILVMFSGGLDSTGVLYYLLTEKEYNQYNIHVHHMILNNKENRAVAEDMAVSNIVNYFKNNGFREFDYSESYHEYPMFNNGFIWDSDLTSFIAGTICHKNPAIRHVALGKTASDTSPSLAGRIKRADRIFELFSSKATKIHPVGGLTKEEIYKKLPKELLDITWSCRTPHYVNNVPQKCGACMTCRKLKEICGRQ